jgi:valyl-tRNA synthetase
MLPRAAKPILILVAPETETVEVLQRGLENIRQLAVGEKITILQKLDANPPQSASTVLTGVTVYLPLKGLLDLDKEIAKVRKEIENALAEQKRLEAKLGNPGFTAKAPEDVVAKEKEKLMWS